MGIKGINIEKWTLKYYRQFTLKQFFEHWILTTIKLIYSWGIPFLGGICFLPSVYLKSFIWKLLVILSFLPLLFELKIQMKNKKGKVIQI